MQASDKLIAIDVLLEPDQTMISKANAVNARLRENYPAGYELDATHAPHVTLLQRYVRVRDLPPDRRSKGFRDRAPNGVAVEGDGDFLWNVERSGSDNLSCRAYFRTDATPSEGH